MSGPNMPVVFYPRYTTFLGGGPIWFTVPIPVAAYASVYVDFWHGSLMVAPTVGVTFQESNDGTNWTTCDGGPWTIVPAPGENSVSALLSKAWFQFGVSFGGGPTAGVTCWAEGFFELRER